MRHGSRLAIAWLVLVSLSAAAGVFAQSGPRRRPERGPRPAPAPTAAPRHPSFAADIPCGACHTPDGWSLGGGDSSTAGGFNHARTGFPLVGRHLAVGCTNCHAAGRQVRRDCVSCHRDDHDGRLGNACANCHDAVGWTHTNDLNAHRLTRFPLTGMHAIAACTDCHQRSQDRTFSAVPSQCYACHDNDYRRIDVHPRHDGSTGSAPFSRDCASCHRTTSWSPAIIDPSMLERTSSGLTEQAPPRHELRFPIRAGSHQGLACATCHESIETPSAVRCAGCHAHGPARLAEDHRTVRPGLDGRGCLGCHPGGIAR